MPNLELAEARRTSASSAPEFFGVWPLLAVALFALNNIVLSTCVGAIAIAQIAELSTWAGMRGAELCSSCISNAASTGCPTVQSVRTACNSGVCELLVP